jgi:hypothetical protein
VLDQDAEVAGAPGDAAIPLEPGALEDKRLESGLLTLVQGAGPAGTGPVAQALHTLRIVAVHPIPERLAGHPGEPGRFFAGQAVERVGQGEQPGADPTVALAAGQVAQLSRIAVGPDWQGGGHRGISERNATATPQRPKRSVTTS